ncbi:MAG: pseudouridine synthase, partial [Rhodobacteraceae bacterium]|nr:pseudouridine synthase [Paracoccaceae bacterium]
MMPPDSTITVRIRKGAAGRLDTALTRNLPDGRHLSRSRISRIIRAGRVSCRGSPVRDTSARVMAGEIYEIDTSDDRASDISPENIPLTIIHEDRDIIVINKAAGMVMHPAPGNRKGTLLSAVLHHDRRSSLAHEMPALVHRLDKDTTGLLVVARTARAMADLTAQFAAHSAGRI